MRQKWHRQIQTIVVAGRAYFHFQTYDKMNFKLTMKITYIC